MKPLDHPTTIGAATTGGFVDAFGGRYYRISACDRLGTFFMNVVSASDLWLFLASNGGLTAGRRDAEHALFPYQSVDRLYDSAGMVGPFTAMWVEADGRQVFWEPLAPHAPPDPQRARHLYKSIEGDRVFFEEEHAGLGLVFRYGWAAAEEHGWVRQCELENATTRDRAILLLDGLRNLQPAGIPRRVQDASSCLADAYKTARLIDGTTLAVFALAAGIVDRATPLETLRASVAWSDGLPGAAVLLSEAQIAGFRRGEEPAPESEIRGVRTSYLLAAPLLLGGGETQRWMIGADTDLTHAAVAARHQALRGGSFARVVRAAVDASTRRLRAMIGAADGLQTGGDERLTAHHFSNVLFNVMRGGSFVRGHEVHGSDFEAFLRVRNRPVAERQRMFLRLLPDVISCAGLRALVLQREDPALERLALEFLPLAFGRRHGDPSRPWNRFTVCVRDESGNLRLHYEGNWRDIFQNWEALCLGYPEYLEHVVAKFVNASTADGFNPYRLTAAGIEWEVPDAEDPWATIGYWGDHQVVYLLRLLEWSARIHPGRLGAWLRRRIFSSADVPYRIADYEAMRRDPRSTIEFDAPRHRGIEERVGRLGTDARLLLDERGEVVHVTLAEKLLLNLLVRLTNFVPGGGIWMNTQRPEWNDANNALVGHGVSVVTLCHLRRFLVHWREVCAPALGSGAIALSPAVATLLGRVRAAFEARRADVAGVVGSAAQRRLLLDELASAGAEHRRAVYAGGSGAPEEVATEDIAALVDAALVLVDETIRANRRPDGLYHAYNLLEFTDSPAAGLGLHRLALMLEGQVAALSAGLLSCGEAVALLEALRASPLFRPDQHSYLLYPDRRLPAFMERNVVPEDRAASCALLAALGEGGDARLVERDATGKLRFHADLVNAAALEQRLRELAAEPQWAALVESDRERVHALYESVFHHRAFTGRSGSMFGYEGLGCIYWHMVAKLLLAVQENAARARDLGDPRFGRLVELYFDVRAGLGFNKTPADFGAFPTDSYSHTPGHSGAQQPGMTGQVKEEIVTRLGELGVEFERGALGFRPFLLRASEFTAEPTTHRAVDAKGDELSLDLPAGALAFSVCGVPVVYSRTAVAARIHVFLREGREQEVPGSWLDTRTSGLIFERSGRVTRLEVDLGRDFRPLDDLPCAPG